MCGRTINFAGEAMKISLQTPPDDAGSCALLMINTAYVLVLGEIFLLH